MMNDRCVGLSMEKHAHFNCIYYSSNSRFCEVTGLTNLFEIPCAECFIRTAFAQIRYVYFAFAYHITRKSEQSNQNENTQPQEAHFIAKAVVLQGAAGFDYMETEKGRQVAMPAKQGDAAGRMATFRPAASPYNPSTVKQAKTDDEHSFIRDIYCLLISSWRSVRMLVTSPTR